MRGKLLPWRKDNKNYATVHRDAVSGGEFGLIAFNGEIRNDIVRNFHENFMIQGDHVSAGGKASPVPLLTLLGAGGAMGLSAATSGTLFMATANPATLMAIQNGVGSAVMAGGAIVKHAPFIPVSGAIVPVIAPVLAFQCLATVAILREFAEVKKGIVNVQRGVARVIERQEATFIGETLSACNRLDKLEQEFEICSGFTTDMIVRLALLENSVNPIFERHQYLYANQVLASSEDWAFKQGDAKLAIVLSLLDLRLDSLRVQLAIQENPGFVQPFAGGLLEKLDRYRDLWRDIGNSPKEAENAAQQLRELTSSMSWWSKNMPGILMGKRTQRKEQERKAEDLQRAISVDSVSDLVRGADRALEAGEALKKKLRTANPMGLVYWRDEMGEHSYYTDDVLVA